MVREVLARNFQGIVVVLKVQRFDRDQGSMIGFRDLLSACRFQCFFGKYAPSCAMPKSSFQCRAKHNTSNALSTANVAAAAAAISA